MNLDILRRRGGMLLGILWITGCLQMAFAQDAATYKRLWKGYRQALAKNQETYAEQRAEMNRKYFAALEAMEKEFRDAGNLSYMLAAKNTLRFAKQGDPLAAPKTDVDRVVSLYQAFRAAHGSLNRQENEGRYRIMKVMLEHLDSFIEESVKNDKIELAELAKAETGNIRNDPDFMAAQQAEDMREQELERARNNAESTRPVFPTPTPVPAGPRGMARLEQALLEVDLTKKNLARHDQQGDFDDQVQNICFIVSIQSRELVKNYEDLRIKVWGVGRDVNSRHSYKMLLQETLKLDSLPRGRSAELETRTVENKFDDSQYAKFGHKFYGYVLEIEDKNGNTLFSKASPSRFEREAEEIKKHRENQVFRL